MIKIMPDQYKQLVLRNVIFYLLGLLIAFGLKYHYSRAGSDDLVWILRPTAGLVEHISGIHFEQETGTGFVSLARHIIIAPSCAGINFLIIAFCMTAFSFIHYIRHNRLKLLWLGISGVNAYLLTIAVNAIRIMISIHLYEADIYYGWITRERVHRIEGILVYFFFLYVSYLIIGKIMNHYTEGVAGKKRAAVNEEKNYSQMVSKGLIPLFWYFGITLIVPLLNTAYRESGLRFLEHCRAIVSVCLVVFLFMLLIQLSFRFIAGNIRMKMRGYKSKT